MDKYPGWSGYNYVMNNPLVLVDPDGMRVELYIKGEDAEEAYDELKDESELTLTFDPKSGQVTTIALTAEEIGGLSEADRELYDAIQSENVAVNLITTRENKIGSNNYFCVGAFGGNSLDKSSGKKIATQYINLKHAEKLAQTGLSSVGKSVVHESVEAYLGAMNNWDYEKSHDATLDIMDEGEIWRTARLIIERNTENNTVEGRLRYKKMGQQFEHIIFEGRLN